MKNSQMNEKSIEEIRFTESERTKINAKTIRGCYLKIEKDSIQNASKVQESGNEYEDAG